MKWLKLLWEYIQSQKFRVFVGAVLDVYVDLVKGEITPEQALNALKSLVIAFVESILVDL
jgi:hypothetical protein